MYFYEFLILKKYFYLSEYQKFVNIGSLTFYKKIEDPNLATEIGPILDIRQHTFLNKWLGQVSFQF